MHLPALREELVVHAGPRLHDGQPSWTLQDPARHRFFRLDWLTFEILQRWSLGEPALVARVVAEQTSLRPTVDDVLAVATFAGTNQLLRLGGADTSAALAGAWQRLQPGWWQWLIHNYLFFRVPLIRPERLLRWLHARLAWMFTASFWWLTAGAAATGAWLAWRQWEEVRHQWVDLASLHGFLGYALVLVGVKMVHEAGHGLVATHFGCRVPSMGVAFLVMTPVAYTDTNDAWILPERRPRLLIGAAGMLAEVALAAWATLLWGLLPDGYLRSALFLVATTTWIKSLVVNTSPLMRFDGYYLLSDYLDLPNLHSRAFALARWRLREWLFGFGDAPPEYFPRTLARGLTALAMFIWVYRLVVFLGIALFVYHFFFKALGLVLFAVEIGWFVALPIGTEIKHWLARRREIHRSPRFRGGLAALALLAVLAAIPLPRQVQTEGLRAAAQEFRVVAPEAARLTARPVPDGATVQAGEPLLRLESPALRQRAALARARITRLTAELTSAGASAVQRQRTPILASELATANAALQEAEASARQLAPVAPFTGRFHWEEVDLNAGDDVGRGERLGLLVDESRWQVIAYVDEQSAHLVRAGASGRFYADDRAAALRVVSVEADASRHVPHTVLTTEGGGALPVRPQGADLVPERAVYRVTLALTDTPTPAPGQTRRGIVVIFGSAESRLARWSRQAVSVVWRELGF